MNAEIGNILDKIFFLIGAIASASNSMLYAYFLWSLNQGQRKSMKMLGLLFIPMILLFQIDFVDFGSSLLAINIKETLLSLRLTINILSLLLLIILVLEQLPKILRNKYRGRNFVSVGVLLSKLERESTKNDKKNKIIPVEKIYQLIKEEAFAQPENQYVSVAKITDKIKFVDYLTKDELLFLINESTVQDNIGLDLIKRWRGRQ